MTRRVHFGAGATTTIREYQIERIPGFDSPKMKKLDSRKKVRISREKIFRFARYVQFTNVKSTIITKFKSSRI